MNKMLAALTAATIGLGTSAFADPAAIAEANERKICRDFKAVDAEYLEDGTLKVLCPAGYLGPTGAIAGTAGLPTTLAGTGLTAGAAAGILAAAVFVGVVAGDDDAVSTTTTTSP
jgi:hypothetical protein